LATHTQLSESVWFASGIKLAFLQGQLDKNVYVEDLNSPNANFSFSQKNQNISLVQTQVYARLGMNIIAELDGYLDYDIRNFDNSADGGATNPSLEISAFHRISGFGLATISLGVNYILIVA
jgi:hypothetical protein